MRKHTMKKENGRYNYQKNIKAETTKTNLFVESVKGFNTIH